MHAISVPENKADGHKTEQNDVSRNMLPPYEPDVDEGEKTGKEGGDISQKKAVTTAHMASEPCRKK